ncbi:hypothetical protein MBLNU13_g08356t1 [Cladosporium sp. NU13]
MPHASSTIKDPWEIEHELFLQQNPNAIAHSDTFYTGVVHKGFDADDTAVELIRRYPAFEEEEQHRKFLVRSISERLVIPGEQDGYFTPEQLWREDDRISGKWCSLEKDVESGSDEQSVIEEDPEDAANAEIVHQPVVLKAVPKGVIGGEELEDDEQLARLLSDPSSPKRPGDLEAHSHEDVALTDDDLADLFGEEAAQPTIVITTPSPKHGANGIDASNDTDLPITFQTEDHTTTITREYADVQLYLDTLDISHEVPLRAITHCSADGSLVVALLGHLETDTKIISKRHTTEQAASCGEWHLVSERPQSPAVAFFSGTETCSDLIEEIFWDPNSTVATSLAYNDGRILIMLVGELSRYGIYHSTLDPAELCGAFFNAMRKNKEIPAEHAEMASLLQVAQRDMVEAGTLP